MACGNCDDCGTRLYCQPFKSEPNRYNGIRFTADCFDCAFQLSIDTYSACSFDCLYCFSNYLARNPELKAGQGPQKAAFGAMPPSQLEDLLDLQRDGGSNAVFRDYIRQDMPQRRRVVQWGALGDPFDNIERWNGLGLQYLSLFGKYEQPVRVSTKGGLLLLEKPYMEAVRAIARQLWFAFSIITIDDDVLTRIDRRAPNATERLKAMKMVTDAGAKASLRFRPILRNVSDRTSKHPHAWRDLLRRARDAGACAVSMEFVFVPSAMKFGVGWRWDEIERVTRYPYRSFYKKTSDVFTSCLRSSRWWKEGLTHAVREEAHALGMTFAISDPHWKELNDTGNCCGVQPDDPVFGGWEHKQATAALVNAARDPSRLLRLEDVVPEWAKVTPARKLLCITGPKGTTANALSFAEYQHQHIWNDPNHARGPRVYFGGVLEVAGMDENRNLLYRYVGQQRRFNDYGWQTT